MAALTWGQSPRLYDYGLDRGVLYLDGTGVPWNGLASAEEQESGFINTEYYFEGSRIQVSSHTGDFRATIDAYTYPDAFAEIAEGSADRRFGLSYRTQHELSHRIHLVYDAMVRPSQQTWRTETDSPQPSLFSWDLLGSDVAVPGASPASHLVVDTLLTASLTASSVLLEELDDILYGTETTQPRLPSPAELVALYEKYLVFIVTYNGDGTYTVTAPAEMLSVMADGTFSMTAPTIDLLSESVFVVSSS